MTRRRARRPAEDKAEGPIGEGADSDAAPTENGEKKPPLVAIVGRPNVGKSTLFNRIVGGHNAIVEDEPGVTRDRRYGDADWDGRAFRVVDTGGLDLSGAKHSAIGRGILTQAMRAIDEADLVMLVLDAKEGVTSGDRESVEVLRRAGKRILYVANKVDGAREEAKSAEVFSVGADEVIGISATHGRNIAELLDAILERLPDAPRWNPAPPEHPIRIALVGKPNAGKSSLVNRLVGEERVIVDAVAGTTRDPVDTPIMHRGRKMILIDTAGIRKRARIEAPMEKIAVAMAEKALGRCDVAVLVVDGEAGITEQEAKIAGLCEDAGRALVIAFNKRDLIDGKAEKKLHEELERQLQFVPWAKVVSCSAKSGRGVDDLLERVDEVYQNYSRRVSTGELNRWFEGVVDHHPPSLYRGHPVKLYYITQAAVRPPAFVLQVNHPDGVHFSYARYLQNQLRKEFGFQGTPVRLILRQRSGLRQGQKGPQPPKR